MVKKMSPTVTGALITVVGGLLIVIVQWLLSLNEPNIIRPVIAVKTFDLVRESIGSPHYLQFDSFSVDSIEESVSESILPKVLEVVLSAEGSNTEEKISLRIEGSMLYTDKPIFADLYLRFQTPAQLPSPRQYILPESPMSIHKALELTANPYGPSNSDLKLNIRDQSGRFYTSPSFGITRDRSGGFKFVDNNSPTFVLRLKRKPLQVLINDATATGSTIEDTDAIADRFTSALRVALQATDDLEVTGFTLAQLEEKREELKNLDWSSGKTQIIEEFAVDYIIDTSLILE